MAAVVLLLALLAITGLKTWRDLRAAERREAGLAAAIATTRAEIAALEHRIERLRHDPDMLERVAREELRMVYPGEVTVLLPVAGPVPEAAPEPIPGTSPEPPPRTGSEPDPVPPPRTAQEPPPRTPGHAGAAAAAVSGADPPAGPSRSPAGVAP